MKRYATVREKLGMFVGRTVLEITQQDEDEYQETGEAYILLMFDDGTTLKFPVTERPVVAEGPR
jgi:hypothetical protein